MPKKMVQFAIRNDTLVYRKTGRTVSNQEKYRIRENRVYVNGRLKGYLGKLPKSVTMVPKSKRKTFKLNEGIGGLAYAKSGKPVKAKLNMRLGGFDKNFNPIMVAVNKKGKIVGKIKTNGLNLSEIDDIYFNRSPEEIARLNALATEYEPEITLPSTKVTKPAGFTEVGLDPFYSNYKNVVEVLGPTVGPAEKVLGPGAISVEQRSFINFANSLNDAVNAGFLTEEEAEQYFKWYSYADNKQRSKLWDELYDYYEEQGYDASG